MPLRCPAGVTRAAPFLTYTSSLSSTRIPLRICSSCRARLSNTRRVSTLSSLRRPAPVRYQFLADNLPPRSTIRNGVRNFTKAAAAYYAAGSKQKDVMIPESNLAAPKLVILGVPGRHRRLDEQVEPAEFSKVLIDDLAKELQTFEYQVAHEEVPNEIVLFKPDNLRVSKSRFDQLFKELDNAFLGPQLKEYLQTTDLNIGGGIWKLRKKDALNLVLRQVWTVQVDEEIAAEMDVIREKELKFRTMDLFFMMTESGDLLQKTASRHRTRIVLNSKGNTVLLRGTNPSIEAVERTLNSLPPRIIDREVDISALTRVGIVREQYIPSISRLTSAFIEISEDKMHLYGIKPYGERSMSDALRLVFNSLDLHLRETHSLLGETRMAESISGALYPIAEDQTLPWMYRGREWSRWRSIRTPRSEVPEHLDESEVALSVSSPLMNPAHGDKVGYNDIRRLLDSVSTFTPSIPAAADADAVLDSILDADTTPAPEDASLETPKAATETTNPAIPPGAEIQTTYRAVLGQILHSSPSLPKTREAKSLSDLLASKPSHVLCNSVPRLIDFLSTLNPVTFTYDFKILLKFSPSPWKHPKTFEMLPPVEMELQIEPETNELLAIKVAAVESHGIVDVLMPRNGCDLRFVRKTLARVEGQTQGVKNYLRNAKLDVLGEERLEAGEALTLGIPKWMTKEAEKHPEWAEEQRNLLLGERLAKEAAEEEKRRRRLDYRKEEEIAEPVVFATENQDGEAIAHISNKATDAQDGAEIAVPKETIDELVGNTDDIFDTVQIGYHFSGLETRSSTTFDFDGSPLVYTKVEAGASGGSYDEVVLQCQAHQIEYLTPLEQANLAREEEAEKQEDELEKEKKWAKALKEWKEEEIEESEEVDFEAPVFNTGDAVAAREREKAREKEERLARKEERANMAGSDMEMEGGDVSSKEADTEWRQNFEDEVEAGIAGTDAGQTESVDASEPTAEVVQEAQDGRIEEQDNVESSAEGPESEVEKVLDAESAPERDEVEQELNEEEAQEVLEEAAPQDSEPVAEPSDFGYLLGEEPEEPETLAGASRTEEDPDAITDEVFNRFVQTARKLVEVVESTETDHERTKPKML